MSDECLCRFQFDGECVQCALAERNELRAEVERQREKLARCQMLLRTFKDAYGITDTGMLRFVIDVSPKIHREIVELLEATKAEREDGGEK